ncbi:MAG: contractile injection system protein, VgrG/Pvc8 family [Thermodesulfobacteriota bacterium]
MTEPRQAFISARPRFRIAGQDQPSLGEAVLAAQVTLPWTGMGHAELRFLNWGATGGGRQPDFPFQGIRLGDAIAVLMGEEAEDAVFAGDITGIEERYGDGAPQMVLLAEDRLHRLARLRASRAFEEMSLDDVVRQLAQEVGLAADVQAAGFPATWLQMNESHLAFLTRLLAPLDLGVRLAGGRLRVRAEEEDPQPVPLSPQMNVDRLRLLADLNRQPRQLAVWGYNLAQDSDAEATGAGLQPAPAGRTAVQVLAELGWEGEAACPHPFSRSQAEAELAAKGRFRSRARRFLYGELVCRGLSAMTAGRQVELAGVSERFAGRYQVMVCEHRFDTTSGFSTRLAVERPDWRP